MLPTLNISLFENLRNTISLLYSICVVVDSKVAFRESHQAHSHFLSPNDHRHPQGGAALLFRPYGALRFCLSWTPSTRYRRLKERRKWRRFSLLLVCSRLMAWVIVQSLLHRNALRNTSNLILRPGSFRLQIRRVNLTVCHFLVKIVDGEKFRSRYIESWEVNSEIILIVYLLKLVSISRQQLFIVMPNSSEIRWIRVMLRVAFSTHIYIINASPCEHRVVRIITNPFSPRRQMKEM